LLKNEERHVLNSLHTSVAVEARTAVASEHEPDRLKHFNWLAAKNSIFVISLVLFIGLNRLALFQFAQDRYDWPDHNFAWWTVHDWRSLKMPPDLVLIGSSTIYKAVNGADANFLSAPVDEALSHRSRFLEQALSQKTEHLKTTFDLSTPGQLCSDAFAINAALLSDTFKPKVIVWGVFPRDFIDNSFKGTLSSDVTRYMNRISVHPVVENDRPTLSSRAEEIAASILGLFQKRIDYLCYYRSKVRAIFEQLFDRQLNLAQVRNARFTVDSVHNPLLDVTPGVLMTGPDLTSGPYLDNSGYYRLAYARLDQQIFSLQCHYFESFLQRCNSLAIKVAVVNMPITDENQGLLPPGAYENYKTALNTITRKNRVAFYDLNEKGAFTKSDYADPVHLNCIGAEKFLRLLSNRLNWDELTKDTGNGVLSSVDNPI